MKEPPLFRSKLTPQIQLIHIFSNQNSRRVLEKVEL